jgi:hypothetical protein
VLEVDASKRQGRVSNSLLSRIDFKDECVDNCVVVAAVANLATDSATSTVCASHLPRQTTKWLAYGCHTSVLLVDWCVPFLVLFQLCDVPQTLNIQQHLGSSTSTSLIPKLYSSRSRNGGSTNRTCDVAR